MRSVLAMLALAVGAWRPCTAQPNSGAESSASCTMLEVELPRSDSILVSVPLARCAGAQLVIVGLPRRTPTVPDNWIPGRFLEIPVAVKNIRGRSLKAPIEMEADSLTPVQYGRQLNWWYSRSYVEPSVWPGSAPPTWRFGGAEDSTRAIAQGERSETKTIKFTVQPLTQKFRLWLTIRTPGQRHEYVAHVPPFLRRAPDTGPLGTDVGQFIAAARLPKLREQYALFRQPEHDIVLFSVSYGDPQDCPSGCFYSGALGLKYGRKIGWIRIDDYAQPRDRRTIGRDSFPLAATDTYLFSRAFIDTLTTLFGLHFYAVGQGVLPLLLQHPDVPREMLLRYTESLYAGMPDQQLVGLIENIPRVRKDVGLLTLLANLPDGGPPFVNARNNARRWLLALGSSIVADSTTSARTLFLLAQQIYLPDSNDSLVQSVIDHPNAKHNIAILAVLVNRDERARVRMMSFVRAPERMLRMLDEHLRSPPWRYDLTVSDAALLAEAVATHNEDVLLVLANASPNFNVASEATRKLPETALKRREAYYVPLP